MKLCLKFLLSYHAKQSCVFYLGQLLLGYFGEVAFPEGITIKGMPGIATVHMPKLHHELSPAMLGMQGAVQGEWAKEEAGSCTNWLAYHKATSPQGPLTWRSLGRSWTRSGACPSGEGGELYLDKDWGIRGPSPNKKNTQQNAIGRQASRGGRDGVRLIAGELY